MKVRLDMSWNGTTKFEVVGFDHNHVEVARGVTSTDLMHAIDTALTAAVAANTYPPIVAFLTAIRKLTGAREGGS